jgi:hypothetical protein
MLAEFVWRLLTNKRAHPFTIRQQSTNQRAAQVAIGPSDDNSRLRIPTRMWTRYSLRLVSLLCDAFRPVDDFASALDAGWHRTSCREALIELSHEVMQSLVLDDAAKNEASDTFGNTGERAGGLSKRVGYSLDGLGRGGVSPFGHKERIEVGSHGAAGALDNEQMLERTNIPR